RQKHANITQHLLYADDKAHKLRLLDHLLRDASLDQAIVFTATKRGADDLADHLSDIGFSAAALHGDMNQRQRTRTLGLMQKGQVRVLVATDVAARGIDVQTISHAVNYDLPLQAEDYAHRIGRTGRAGRDGQAITLAVHAERHKVRRIEQFIGQSIPIDTIPGLEPVRSVRPTYRDKARNSRPQGGKPWHKAAGEASHGDTRARKPWHKDRNAAEPVQARKPWQQDKPARAARSQDTVRGEYATGSERPAHRERAEYAPRPSHADHKRSDRPAFAPRTDKGGKAGTKSAFKHGARRNNDHKSAQRPRFA